MTQNDSFETIQRKAQSLEVINSFATALMEATTENELIWCIIRHALAKLGYDDCVVYTVDPGGETIRQNAALSPEKNPADDTIANVIVLKMGEGICGTVAKTGIAEIIPDTEKDDRYVVDDSSRLSEIAVPIVDRHGTVLGVIDSEHPEKNFYNETDLEILSTVAKMTATRLGQARAMAELRKNEVLLQQKVDRNYAELLNMIVELQRSNEEIERRDREKDTLLKEIHHRVKNNLQIVSSIMSLQASKPNDQATTEIFIDCQNRIKSMAIIHEQLYDQGDLAQIATDEYIKIIAESLRSTYQSQHEIGLTYTLKMVHLNIEKSVPFGLILNELLVNCFKHAFRNRNGNISISMYPKNKEVFLKIQDSGIGFDQKNTFESMGIGLVKALTEQLEGTIEFHSNKNGTTVSLRFPV